MRGRVVRRPTLVAALVVAALLAALLRGPLRPRPSDPEAAPSADEAPVRTDRVTQVLDGDTVLTAGGETIRLIGMDAPEENTPYCRAARDALAALVEGQRVRLVYGRERRDRYGRSLAHVYVSSGSAAETLAAGELLRRGLASYYGVPPNLSRRRLLVEAQREAVEARRGIWSLPVIPEDVYVAGAFRFHRPSCPHAREIPRPRRTPDRWALILSGKSPCRRCRP